MKWFYKGTIECEGIDEPLESYEREYLERGIIKAFAGISIKVKSIQFIGTKPKKESGE